MNMDLQIQVNDLTIRLHSMVRASIRMPQGFAIIQCNQSCIDNEFYKERLKACMMELASCQMQKKVQWCMDLLLVIQFYYRWLWVLNTKQRVVFLYNSDVPLMLCSTILVVILTLNIMCPMNVSDMVHQDFLQSVNVDVQSMRHVNVNSTYQ